MTIRADAHRPEFHRAAPPQLPVRVATTANVTISTALNSGDTIDGVTLAAGDRVLVKDQSTGSQNGIYIAGASPARAFDMEEGVAAYGAVIYVVTGTANGGKQFKNTNTTVPTIDSTALTFAEITTSGGTLEVSDGTTSVDPTSLLSFDPASFEVSDEGAGEALVTFVGTAGGGGGTAFVGARVYNNANISLTSGSVVYLTFNSEEFDSDSFHSTSSNTGRLTVPAGMGGKYLVIGNAEVTANVGENYATIRKNGTTVLAIGQSEDADNGASVYNFSTVVELAAGDYVEFGIRVGAASKSAVVDLISPMFMIAKIGSGGRGDAVGVSVRASANQTVNNGNALYDTEEFDTDGFHSTSSNTDRLTVPSGLGGKYLVWASGGLTTANALDMRFFVNGSQQKLWAQSSAIGTGSELMSISGVVDLAAGDYVTVNCYTAGVNRTFFGASGGFSSAFGMMRLDSGSGDISSGTSFPGSPATNQRVFRTDRGVEYFYDGTRWLSTQSFSLDFAMQDNAVNSGMNAGSINAGRARVPWQGTYSLFVQRFQISFVTSGTNNGSNYSTFKLNYGDSADADTQVGTTISTAALSANTVYDLSDTVDAVLSTNARWLKCRKDNGAGTPGNGIFVTAGIIYRLVG